MLSIVITAYKEAGTIGRAIEAIIQQKINQKYELLVVAPDKETEKAVQLYPQVRYLKDPGEGKPKALNLALKKARGDILILTDGDVYLQKDSINELLTYFKDPKTGIVSGRPMSLNQRSNKFGYYSHLLTDLGAHETRLKRTKEGKMIVCSGYLYAFRKDLISSIPENVFSEDAVISHMIFEKGYKTAYAPNAKVWVKYPDNLADWIKQKKRSAGGYNQLKLYAKSKERMRSFTKEDEFDTHA